MLCGNCFKEKSENSVCPHCGYDGVVDAEKYTQALPAGTILNGQYTIGRVLGQGGFGITYIAQEYGTKELVAIKEYLPAEYSTRGAGTGRLTVFTGEKAELFEYGKEKFLEEAKTLAQFRDNANICRVQRYFEENGTAYIAMEYIEGISLDRYMKQHGGRLSTEEAMRLLTPVMEALKYVHSKGVIHRDIAPDNIIITESGTVKLIDFGAARYSIGEKTRSLTVILKHGFAPFEQYSRKGEQGAYTDVYALSATIYYALTGRIPPDAIDRIDGDTLMNPAEICSGIRQEFGEAVLKGLSVKSSDRYRSMAEMKEAFDATSKSESQPKPEPQPKSEPDNGTEQKIKEMKKPDPTNDAPQKIVNNSDVKTGTNSEKREDSDNSGKKRKTARCVVALIFFVCLITCLISKLIVPLVKYNEAMVYLNAEWYSSAIQIFEDLDDYRDSEERILECRYSLAMELFNDGQYENAKTAFEQLNGYGSSEDMIRNCSYYRAEELYKSEEYEEAVKWFNKANLQGSEDALNALGMCYYNGLGVEQNYDKAVELFREADNVNNADAQNNLGLCYYFGYGVNKDYSEAAIWFKKAANQGHADAQYNLGCCYSLGEGVKKDYSEAAIWLEKAANQGHADAQFLLGCLYLKGQGVDENHKTAVRWFKKAAEQGYAEAQYYLGLCYCNGDGIKQDYEEAKKWLRKARKQGHEEAQEYLNKLQ